MPNIIVDQLFHALTPEELEAAAIDSVSQQFNGMDCWCVTLETPQDDAVLQKLAHKSPDGFQKYREKYIGTLGICIGVFSVAVLLCAYLLKRYRNRGNA